MIGGDFDVLIRLHLLAGGGAEGVDLPERGRDEDEEVVEVAARGCLELELDHVVAAFADRFDRIDDFNLVVARFNKFRAFAWSG